MKKRLTPIGKDQELPAASELDAVIVAIVRHMARSAAEATYNELVQQEECKHIPKGDQDDQ